MDKALASILSTKTNKKRGQNRGIKRARVETAILFYFLLLYIYIYIYFFFFFFELRAFTLSHSARPFNDAYFQDRVFQTVFPPAGFEPQSS
jgi:Trk-type K+ transport system membrane component